MPDVSCPSCSESVRIPNVELPKGGAIQCPLCSHVSELSAWKEQSLPQAILIDALGNRLDVEPTAECVSDTRSVAAVSDTPSKTFLVESLEDEIRVGAERACEKTVISDTVIVAPNALDSLAADPFSPEENESTQQPDDAASEPTIQLLDSDSYIEPDAFEEEHSAGADESGVDIHDQELESSAASSGDSLIQMDEDDFPSDLATAQPSIDEIENAWDSPEDWEPHEVSSYDEFAEELSGAVLSKTRREKESSSRRRRSGARRRRKAIRALKLASPTVAALLIVAGVFYRSGVNLGFYPFNGTAGGGSKITAALETAVSQQDESQSEAQNPTLPSRVLVDTDEGVVDQSEADVASQFALQKDSNEQPTDKAQESAAEIVAGLFAHQESSSEDDHKHADGIDSVIQSLQGKAAELGVKRAEKPPKTVAMQARKQWQQRKGNQTSPKSNDPIAKLNRATLRFPSQAPSIQDVIPQQVVSESDVAVASVAKNQTDGGVRQTSAVQDADSSEKNLQVAPPNGSDAATDQMPNGTAVDALVLTLPITQASAMPLALESSKSSAIAESSKEANEIDRPDDSTNVSVADVIVLDDPWADANGPVEADDSAQIDAPGSELVTQTPRLQERVSNVPPKDSKTDNQVSTETDNQEVAQDQSPDPVSPDTPPAEIADTPELIAATEQALELIARLPGDSDDAGDKQAVVARLLAYRAVARIGGMSMDPDSPAVAKVFDRLSQSQVQDQLTTLCGEWINWGRRKTDGILLIGSITRVGTDTQMHLNEGSQFQLVGDEALNLPAGSLCIVIGKIKSSSGTPIVQVVAATTAP